MQEFGSENVVFLAAESPNVLTGNYTPALVGSGFVKKPLSL